MKNPYVNLSLILSLIFSFVFTLVTVIDTYHAVFYHTMSSQIANTVETFFIYPLLPLLYLAGYGFAFLLGISLEFIGPVIIFVSWFIVFYLLTYGFARITKRNDPPKKKIKGLLIICIVSVALFSILVHHAMVNLDQSTFQQPLSPLL